MTLDVARAPRRRPRSGAAPEAWRAPSWPRASCASPTPTWSARFASCPSSAATIRAGSRSSPSAAPAACTPARSPHARHRHRRRAAPRRRAVGARHARRRRDARLLGERPAAGRAAVVARDLDARLAPLVARGRPRPAARRLRRRRVVIDRLDRRALRRPVVRDHACRSQPRYRARVRSAPRTALRLLESRSRPVEVVAVRVRAAGITDKADAAVHAACARSSSPRAIARRPGRFDGRMTPVAFYPLARPRARRARARSGGHHRRRGDGRRSAGLRVHRRRLRQRRDDRQATECHSAQCR